MPTPPLARSTSADRPAAPDTAPLPFYLLLPPSSEETKSDSLYPGGCAPRDNAPHIAATLAAMNAPQTESASTNIPLSPISPSAPQTNSSSGSSLASESFGYFPIRSVHEMTHRTSYRGHATGSSSLSEIPSPPWLHFVLAVPSTPGPGRESFLPSSFL